MEVPFIDLPGQYRSIKDDIDEAISSVIRRGQFIGQEIVHEFELDLARYYGVAHAVCVASGHDALFLSLKSLGIGPLDEVITTAFSWMATANAISQCGAKPVFVDISDDFNLKTDLIEDRISAKTRAIVPVHLYGNPCNMTDILAIANDNKIKVVEDAAQGHGADISGKKVGGIGDLGILSFYPTKQLGAYGDAGCVLTNNSDLASWIRTFSHHGQNQQGEFVSQGINSRMDALQAAVLSVKLRHLETWLEKRRENAGIYGQGLSGVEEVTLPYVDRSKNHSYYNFPILVEKRDALRDWLKNNRIGTGMNYPFVIPETQPYAMDQPFPIARRISQQVLTLPIHEGLSPEQIHKVCNTIKKFYS